MYKMKFNVKFNVRTPNSNKPEKIYMNCRWNNQRLCYPTAYSVIPKYWSFKNHEVKNVIAVLGRDKINNYLYDLRKAALSIYDLANENHFILTKDYLKKGLDKFTGKTADKKMSFFEWLQKYIDDSKDRINPKTGRVVSFRTIQEYMTTVKCLKEFEKQNKDSLSFESFDLNLLKDFRDYLTMTKKFAVNNIAKHINNVRQFFRIAAEENYPIDIKVINPKKLYVAKEEADNIYLNEDEIKAISELKLEGTKDLCRDLLIVGCNTGLRISDFNNIKSHQIKSDFLHIYQKKTGVKVTVPVNQKVSEILKKYDYKIPKISDQKLNDYLKVICKEAGITERIEKVQTKGGQKISTVYNKFELVSAHTARRSYASNMVRRGTPIQSVMRITGHKKESVFMKYVKLSAEEHAQILQKHLMF